MKILEIAIVILIVTNLSLLVVLVGVSEHLGVQYRQLRKFWKRDKVDELEATVDQREVNMNPEVADGVRSELSNKETSRLSQLKKDKNMQDRLRNIKEELDMQHGKIRKGHTATEEHPQVRNLPHDAVNPHEDDREEYSE